jgi:DNA-binding beta-propeller fold protein YncE
VIAALLIVWTLLPSASGTTVPPPACGTVVATGCETWTNVFDDHTEDADPTSVASPDGAHVYVAFDNGLLQTVVQDYDALNGATHWTTAYRDPDYVNAPHVIAISPDGTRLFVVGVAIGGPRGLSLAKTYTLALSASNGSILWVAHDDAPSFGKSVAVSPDGSRVYVTGSLAENYATIAYDTATGARIWESTYDGHGGRPAQYYPTSYDSAFSIAVSQDGSSLYVTGTSASPTGVVEYATVAYDAPSGAQRWVTRYHGTDDQGNAVDSESYSVVASPNSQAVYVLGTAGTRAYDTQTGENLWPNHTDAALCRIYMPMAFLGECVLQVSPDGTRLFAGSHNNLAAYDTQSGATIWNLPIHLGDQSTKSGWPASDIALNRDGTRLYLTDTGGRDSYVTDGFANDYETFAINATNGHLIWRVEAGNGFQRVWMVNAAPDGKHVFVTGESDDHTLGAIMTVAYDTNLGLESAPSLPT